MKHQFFASITTLLLLSSFLNTFGQDKEKQLEIKCWEVKLSEFKKLDKDWVEGVGVLGILNSNQYELLAATFVIPVTPLGTFSIRDKGTASFKQGKLTKKKFKVTPKILADGYTIDLLIEEPPNSKPLLKKVSDIPINVTIWDQQVIAYNLQTDQKTVRFLTAKIISSKKSTQNLDQGNPLE